MIKKENLKNIVTLGLVASTALLIYLIWYLMIGASNPIIPTGYQGFDIHTVEEVKAMTANPFMSVRFIVPALGLAVVGGMTAFANMKVKKLSK